MKGKLHKMVSGYILSLNGDIDDPYAIVNEELAKDHEWHRLSLKNCQAIERGYDLDELAENFWKEEFMKPGLIDTNSYKKGFQKALELMGDKKFSEEDMSKAWSEGYHRKVDEINGNELRYFDKFIQSLQKTEWDVEVEMVKEHMGSGCYKKYPKSDNAGCLILKKYKNG